MNNTRTLAIVAVLTAATLVVGGTLGATTSVFAYQKKGESGSKNGNTVTIQKCKQDATQSGFDNNQAQECQNLICTHPGENATCVQEGAAAAQAQAQAQVKLTCEQCFTKFLNRAQIALLLEAADVTSLAELCDRLSTLISEAGLVDFVVTQLGFSESAAAQLIQCLKDAGIVFDTGSG